MAEALKQAVRQYADAHANAEGIVATAIEGLGMMRVYAPTGTMRAMYKPMLCLVLQGAKQVIAGKEVREFGAGQSLVVTVDRPIIGRITSASQEEPYLALKLEFDMGLMREVMGEVSIAAAPPAEPKNVLFVEETDEAVADCALRLVRLLDRPEAAAVLRSSILKEMHYWMLAGRHGDSIRRLALPDSQSQRLARVVAILRAEFARPLPVERLAAISGMSPSSFHQHFKAVTSLSPLQFQKQLRLLEARRLMLSNGLNASRAAFEVGYESVSQFTREYGRMFGAPPKRAASEGRGTNGRAPESLGPDLTP